MKRLVLNLRPLSGRLLFTAFALICLSLTLFLAFGRSAPDSGTFFASLALAEATDPGAAPGSPQDPGIDETLDSVFNTDPLQSLADSLRRKELELQLREIALAEQERNLETLRLDTQQTLERIGQIHKQMESLAAEADQQRQRQLKKWIEIFQKMSPEKVAPVLTELEPDFQLELVAQMEPSKAAKILNLFPPEKAAELSSKLNQ
jgi:flagellar motility protein MotE (MotC chaperone)